MKEPAAIPPSSPATAAFSDTSPKRKRGETGRLPSLALRACAWLLLLAGGGRADEALKPPLFVVHTAAGKDARGPLRELTADWSVRLGGEGAAVAGGDVLTLRRVGLPLPPLPSDEHVILANGDRIPVRSPRIEGERLHFVNPDLNGGKETSLPLAAVAVLWRTAPERAEDPERLRRQLATEGRPRDVVLLRNGDLLAGVLNGLEADKVAFEVEKKAVSVPLAQVAAVALSTELAEPLRPKGVYGKLVLTGGSGRLSVTGAACKDGATLEATTVFGAALSVPLDRVAALDLFGGRAVYLSDLKPARYEFLPYLDEHWPIAADANAAGHDLLLGGSTYGKGLGLHSHSRLTYPLAGGYRRFEAVVGLDDRDGLGGGVRVRVLADGRPLDLGADGELTPRSRPLALSLPVEGVKELTLEVEFGRNGNVQDVVNWADARVVH
jgi:hypothetical protein